MTYPNPRVIDDSVPEVEQEFDAEVARHRARLEAERAANLPVTPAEERTGADAWGNADCWCKDPTRPHYRGADGCIVEGLTPAGLRTGVSDVQHAVAEEVAEARKLAYAYGLACEALGEAFGEKNGEALVEMRRVVAAAKERLAASFDRIEQWTRGGAS